MPLLLREQREAALEDARARGMQVARGGAEELEQTRPFGLVAAAFGCDRSSGDPRRAAIADLLSQNVEGIAIVAPRTTVLSLLAELPVSVPIVAAQGEP